MPDILLHFFNWLIQTPISEVIAENEVIFPWIEAFHVLGVTLVFGSIAMVDVRLLNIGFTDQAINQFCEQYLTVTWMAFILSVMTGSMLFISNPVNYASNNNFLIKVVLLLCAGINMAIFQYLYGKKIPHWVNPARLPTMARLGATCSILIWSGVIIFGRLIGFTLVPTLSS
jgi:hypothetical protein